jgi:acetate---CoA ligase (ADP-forming)
MRCAPLFGREWIRAALVDQGRPVDIIRRLSELTVDGRHRIAEIDVNPLICAGERQVAVDALIARQTAAPP